MSGYRSSGFRWQMRTRPPRSITPATTRSPALFNAPGSGNGMIGAEFDDYRMYSAKTLEYFREPRRVGPLAAADVSQAAAENPVCGDMLRLWARWADGRVVEAAFQVKGCTASIAAGAAAAEWMEGKSEAELRTAAPAVIEKLLDGLPNESKHAAVLAADGLRAMRAPAV